MNESGPVQSQTPISRPVVCSTFNHYTSMPHTYALHSAELHKYVSISNDLNDMIQYDTHLQ